MIRSDGFVDRLVDVLLAAHRDNSDDTDRNKTYEAYHDVVGCTEAKAVVVGLASHEPGCGGTVTLRVEDAEQFSEFAERFGANVTVLVFKD